MTLFLWVGAALTAAGLAGILWCLRRAAWLRTAALPHEKAAAELRKLVAVNIAAVGAAFTGLALMIVGLLLD